MYLFKIGCNEHCDAVIFLSKSYKLKWLPVELVVAIDGSSTPRSWTGKITFPTVSMTTTRTKIVIILVTTPAFTCQRLSCYQNLFCHKMKELNEPTMSMGFIFALL